MSDTLKQAYRRGFTLIELMIVIVILGILMGTLLPRLTGAQGRARDTGRLADLHNIQLALELYFNDYGQYPSNTDATNYCLTATNVSIGSYLKNGTVPTPPKATKTNDCATGYVYYPFNTNQAYVLAAALESYQQENALFSAAAASAGTCVNPSSPATAAVNCTVLPAAAATGIAAQTEAGKVAQSKVLVDHGTPEESVYAIIGAQ